MGALTMLPLVAVVAAALLAGVRAAPSPPSGVVLYTSIPACAKLNWDKLADDNSCDKFNTVLGTTCDKACKSYMKAVGIDCQRALTQFTVKAMSLDMSQKEAGDQSDAAFKACMDGRPNPNVRDERKSAEEATKLFKKIKGCEHANFKGYMDAISKNPKSSDECVAEVQSQVKKQGDLVTCPVSCKFMLSVGADCWIGIINQMDKGMGLDLGSEGMAEVQTAMHKLDSVCRKNPTSDALARAGLRSRLALGIDP